MAVGMATVFLGVIKAFVQGPSREVDCLVILSSSCDAVPLDLRVRNECTQDLTIQAADLVLVDDLDVAAPETRTPLQAAPVQVPAATTLGLELSGPSLPAMPGSSHSRLRIVIDTSVGPETRAEVAETTCEPS